MSKIQNENFIVVQGWMINDLKLKGNALIIYSIIYGFSQIEGQYFTGSLQYLADWTNSTKQGVIKALKLLIDKGLIEKIDKTINGVKYVKYHVTKFNGVLNKVERGIKQSLHNNIDNNINNNIISKDIGKIPENYGNPDINNLFDEWEKHCGFKINSKIKLNRYACQRLIKSHGYDNVKKAIPFVAQAQSDQYAPGINNFIDLADKWNNLGIWYKKKMANSSNYGTIKL